MNKYIFSVNKRFFIFFCFKFIIGEFDCFIICDDFFEVIYFIWGGIYIDDIGVGIDNFKYNFIFYSVIIDSIEYYFGKICIGMYFYDKGMS